ncbi:hypothetical protein GUITHDRAFT_149908 [Guillardia theta CCMP2712]|uniref:N-acetyltransferase domain-containing protein n=1 Tax=Guillardia theta (strain CCMP2712) TaxID=905079 RepID=L1K2V4_GUITC|nr:hypothetical protein GUITHDRAFT_149908 [Guillardia theta CCMP2712]EKX54934.1 hypothetical protein GUITHDRAFT_149908 [Guillardia theta CCMP2712]|eukprot:XP_005841914.1 hypothetical protein GUITHDRAFT_149908 [Guillardia theta CCMP2712]
MEDVDLIVQHWNYETDTTRDYVSFLIEWKVTVGMYVQHQENTRSLVAWAIEGRDGSIEMIFSLPEWRHNGLARAALHQLTTILLNSHKLQRRLTAPFCTIANADFAMKQLLMASGFTAASELHVLQVGDFALFPAYPEEMEVVYVPQIANTLIPPCGVRRTVYHETLDNHRRLSLAESIETSIKANRREGNLGCTSRAI